MNRVDKTGSRFCEGWFRLTTVLLLGALVVSTGCSKGSGTKAATGVGLEWEDYEEALQKGDKPLMIHFTTESCGWCRKLEAEVYTQASVIEMSQHFRCVQIDGNQEKDLVREYKVRGYPTIIFTDAQGETRHTIVGFLPANQFLAEMEKGLQAAGD